MIEEVSGFLKRIVGEGDFEVFYQERENFGHFSTNAALKLGKVHGKPLMETASLLAEKIRVQDKAGLFERVEAAEPGFINLWLSDKELFRGIEKILAEKKDFGRRKLANKKKIQVEFISANPTGPLTMANGRGGFLGDALANILEFSGYEVAREYLVNDAGAQIKKLGESILAELGEFPASPEHYQAEYIKTLAKKIKPSFKKLAKLELAEKTLAVGDMAQKHFLGEIKKTVKAAGIKFDVWTSEAKDIRGRGLVQKTIGDLKKRRLVYEREGALWLKKEIAGERERVLVKSDGEFTYYAVDLAYHADKFKKYDQVIDIWGADHHGNVEPLKEGLKLFGVKPEDIKILMVQFVRLMKNGEEVKMSKRKGDFVALDELMREVGRDVARFFFLMVSPNSHMDFDLGLAKEKSIKNPVYYAQYALVRCEGILRKASGLMAKAEGVKFEKLNSRDARNLMFELIKFPDIVKETASDHEITRVARYALALSKALHHFYERERIIGAEEGLALERASLVLATKITLANVLGLLGITIKKRM